MMEEMDGDEAGEATPPQTNALPAHKMRKSNELSAQKE